ncbi:hypothetical protein KUTeg_018115 [Tegillarca granosa]|uniref:Uncharacterized protein n=1 Tax=Tegillarca granosa TaxID=220873 RepID=A0ABQ9EKR9_TEGGR|nr:hypothetical protein KUTeg_018115 [Tegillarca granosa]
MNSDLLEGASPGISGTVSETGWSNTCHVYPKALNSDNLQSGFRRTGIYPLDKNVVPNEQMIPADVFRSTDHTGAECDNVSNNNDATVEGGHNVLMMRFQFMSSGR